MSNKLRASSLSNAQRLDVGDEGHWVFLKEDDDDPAVLFITLPNKNVESSVIKDRKVVAKGDYKVQEKKVILLEASSGKIDLNLAKSGIGTAAKLAVGKIATSEPSKPMKKDEDDEDPVAVQKKKQKEEEERRREEEEEERQKKEEEEQRKKEEEEKKEALKKAAKDQYLQKLRIPGRLAARITRLKALSKKNKVMSFFVLSKAKDLKPIVLIDLKSQALADAAKLRRGAPKGMKVVKGQAWIAENVLYLLPVAGSWSPFLKAVRLATKGRVKAVKLALELPNGAEETDEDVSDIELKDARLEEQEAGTFPDPVDEDLTEEEQNLLNAAAEKEKEEENDEKGQLEDIRKRHALLQKELEPYFKPFPPNGSDKETRRILNREAEKDPALTEILRQGVKKMEALDDELKSIGLSKKEREADWWGPFIPVALRSGKYSTPNRRDFYKTAKLRNELMAELDKAGDPLNVIGDIAGAVTIGVSTFDMVEGIGGLGESGVTGKWKGGESLLSDGFEEDAMGNEVWSASKAFGGTNAIIGTTNGTLEGAVDMIDMGRELRELNGEIRKQSSSGKKMMAERKKRKTRRALVTGALELGAGVASHFVPGLGVIGSAAALYREGTELHEYRQKVNQNEIILQSAQGRGEETRDALVGGLKQDTNRMENRRNFAAINTSLTAVTLGADVAVASVIGAPIGAIVKAAAEGTKAAARFAYRGIDSLRAVQAKRAEAAALREGSSEVEQLHAFEKHPHYAKLMLAMAAKEGDPDAMAFFRSRGLSTEDLDDPELTVKDLADFALEEAEESANPGTMLDDVKAVGRKAKEVWDNHNASQAEKFAKKLEASLAEMSELAGEVHEAAALYRDQLLTDQSQNLREPSKATKKARARLETARKAVLKWNEKETKFANEWKGKLDGIDQKVGPKPPNDAAQIQQDAYTERVNGAKAVRDSIPVLEKLVVTLTGVSNANDPANLTPSTKALTPAEVESLQARAPWPIDADPVLLESKQAMQRRAQLQIVQLAQSTGEVESLDEELRDYVSRGVEPTENMKSRVKKVSKTLKTLQDEAAELLRNVPAARKKVEELPNDVVEDKERTDMLQLVEGIGKLAESAAVDTTALLKRCERLTKLADAKPGFFSSLFGSPTDQQIWLKAGKVTVDLDNLMRDTKGLSSEARFAEEDIVASREGGEEPTKRLGELNTLSDKANSLGETLLSLLKEAETRSNELKRAIEGAANEEKEDLQATHQNLLLNVSRASPTMQILNGVQALYTRLSDERLKETGQFKRPDGLLKNTKQLEAFKAQLRQLIDREGAVRTSIGTLNGLVANSPELKAGLRILRAYEKSLAVSLIKIEKGIKDQKAADTRIEDARNDWINTPSANTVEGWRRESAAYAILLSDANGVVAQLLSDVREALTTQAGKVTDPPETCDVPSIKRFSLRAGEHDQYVKESGLLMVALPTLANNGTNEKQRVANVLAPLRPPVAERMEVVRSYLKQIDADWNVLTTRMSRYQVNSLDLEDIKLALKMLDQLKKKLKFLEGQLKDYLNKWDKLQKKTV